MQYIKNKGIKVITKGMALTPTIIKSSFNRKKCRKGYLYTK